MKSNKIPTTGTEVNDINSIAQAIHNTPIGGASRAASGAVASMVKEVARRFQRPDLEITPEPMTIPSTRQEVVDNIAAAAGGTTPHASLTRNDTKVKVGANQKILSYADIVNAVGSAAKGEQLVCDHPATISAGQRAARLLKRTDISFAVAER